MALFHVKDCIRTSGGIPSQIQLKALCKSKHLPYASKEKWCWLNALELSDTTVREPNHSQEPFASLSLKSCSVQLTRKVVRKDQPWLPVQLMCCYQLVDVPLLLTGNAYFTRHLVCFQHMPLFIIWTAATGTLLHSYLSSLMELVTIPDVKFYSESTSVSIQPNSSFLPPQDSTAHHISAVQTSDTWRKEFTCLWAAVVWNYDYSRIRNPTVKLIHF